MEMGNSYPQSCKLGTKSAWDGEYFSGKTNCFLCLTKDLLTSIQTHSQKQNSIIYLRSHLSETQRRKDLAWKAL